MNDIKNLHQDQIIDDSENDTTDAYISDIKPAHYEAMNPEEVLDSCSHLDIQQKEDFKEILAANQKMNELVGVLKKDLDDLDNRFNKDGRDFGKIAIEKTDAINRIINKGSDNASRCIEIASGAELTEKERNV